MRSCVTIKKKKLDQNPTFWPLVTPRHAPGAKFLHHCIPLFNTFNLICNMTMFVQNRFWTLRCHSPLALPPGITSKFRMCSSSPHPYCYHPWKFQDSSLNGLGAMLWHYRWTNVRMDGGITISPLFLSKAWGKKILILLGYRKSALSRTMKIHNRESIRQIVQGLLCLYMALFSCNALYEDRLFFVCTFTQLKQSSFVSKEFD